MAKYKSTYSPKKKKNNFPPWLIFSGVGLLLVAVFLLVSGGNRNKANIEVTGAPSIKVDQQTHDYGDVQLGGTPIKTVVKVTNVGDQPLRFTEAPYIELLEGCWPPNPAIGSMALSPGGSTTISMEFFMHGEMGGKHTFRLHLPTNDPDTPDQTVDIVSNWVE